MRLEHLLSGAVRFCSVRILSRAVLNLLFFPVVKIIDDDLSAVRADGAQTLDSPIAQLVRAPH